MLKTLKNAFLGVKHGHIVHLERKMMLRACACLKEWLKLFMLKKKFFEKFDFFQKKFYFENYQKFFFFWIFGIFSISSGNQRRKIRQIWRCFITHENGHQKPKNAKKCHICPGGPRKDLLEVRKQALIRNIDAPGEKLAC